MLNGAAEPRRIHLMKTEDSSGNPPYSIPPYSTRCAAADGVEFDRGEAMIADQIPQAA